MDTLKPDYGVNVKGFYLLLDLIALSILLLSPLEINITAEGSHFNSLIYYVICSLLGCTLSVDI